MDGDKDVEAKIAKTVLWNLEFFFFFETGILNNDATESFLMRDISVAEKHETTWGDQLIDAKKE